jgi:hypothetical protein
VVLLGGELLPPLHFGLLDLGRHVVSFQAFSRSTSRNVTDSEVVPRSR